VHSIDIGSPGPCVEGRSNRLAVNDYKKTHADWQIWIMGPAGIHPSWLRKKMRGRNG